MTKIRAVTHRHNLSDVVYSITKQNIVGEKRKILDLVEL